LPLELIGENHTHREIDVVVSVHPLSRRWHSR
jgi:hypothetical protein